MYRCPNSLGALGLYLHPGNIDFVLTVVASKNEARFGFIIGHGHKIIFHQENTLPSKHSAARKIGIILAQVERSLKGKVLAKGALTPPIVRRIRRGLKTAPIAEGISSSSFVRATND